MWATYETTTVTRAWVTPAATIAPPEVAITKRMFVLGLGLQEAEATAAQPRPAAGLFLANGEK